MSATLARAAAVALSACLAGFTALPAAAATPPAPGHARPAAPPATPTLGGPMLASSGVVAPPQGPPLPPGLTSGSWLVADMTTGAVLAAKDPHGRFLPASTLKVLTAVTLLPRLNPATMVTANEVDAGVDGTKVGLVPGMQYSVGQLFTAMLVDSANDAADALAGAAGSIPSTLALMNSTAHELRADDTVAGTPSGLDAPGESTSAYDLALITRAAMAIPVFRFYVGIRRAFIPAPGGRHIEIDTHNYLLTTYPGDIGVKNGYTIAARATYIGAATRGGHTILITLMDANPDFWPEARALLDWGFAADGQVTPVGQLVEPLAAPAPAALTHHAVPAARRRPEAQGPIDPVGPVPTALGLAGLVVLAGGNLRRIRRARRRRRPPVPRAGRPGPTSPTRGHVTVARDRPPVPPTFADSPPGRRSSG